MKYCQKCGSEVDEDDEYCADCGVELIRTTVPRGNEQSTRGRGRSSRGRTQGRTVKPEQRSRNRSPEQQNTSRRGFVYGGIGTLVIGGGIGSFLAYRHLNEGPEDVAEDFIEALNEGEMREANSLIHPDARIDGAGAASQILAGYFGIDVLIETADISIVDSETIEESGEEAVVAVTINVDIGFTEDQGDIGIGMREHDDWMVLGFVE